MSIHPIQLELFRTCIPMRGFSHAVASRNTAEAIVARVTYSDGAIGIGETLPRKYVTGESMDSVIADVTEYLWPLCVEQGILNPGPPLRDVPNQRDGRCINAAACLLDLAGYRRYPRQMFPKRKSPSRVSGVLGSGNPSKTAKRLRLMRVCGLRDFKLKLGFGDDVDQENLEWVVKKIGKAMRKGKSTLRVDVNGAWDADSTPERVDELRSYGVCVVEQPTYCSAAELVELAGKCSLPLMADESLLTDADADVLLPHADRVWWNVRISKNGGMGRSLRLLQRAAEREIPCSVGCMVGESGILSAAQRRLISGIGQVRFVEGNYGRFLLKDDLTDPFVTGGYAGRLPVLKGDGLGATLRSDKLEQYGEQVGVGIRAEG